VIPIVDAHHHIWRLSDLAWLNGPAQPRIFGDYESLRRDYLIADFLTDLKGSGVVGSVYIQVNWPVGREVDEAAWVQGVADASGWPHAIVACADFSSEKAPDVLKQLSRFPLLRGIRQQLHWHKNELYCFAPRSDVMNDRAWRGNFARLQDFGWSFELQVFASQMRDAARLAADFPGIPMVLQHAGMPENTSAEGMAVWREGMRALADQPNVHNKLSGLGTFIHKNSESFIADVVGETVELFGPGRCVFGSNFPIEMLWTPYAPIVAAYRKALSHLPEADQRAVLHDNAVRLYRLQNLAAPT